jgi:glutathione S-transferase
MKLYDTLRSGNAWKVRLLAGYLGVRLERQTLSIDRGDLRQTSFLEAAPLAQVPVLQLDDGRHIAESMAILYYLAQGTPWWPATAAEQAQVLTWLSFEQDRHMHPLAQLRLHLALHRDRDPGSPEFVDHARRAREALRFLDNRLQQQGPGAWVATREHPSIADVALYPYSCMAPMGGVDLAAYPQVQRWLRAMEAWPGYQPLFPGAPERNFSTSETAA